MLNIHCVIWLVNSGPGSGVVLPSLIICAETWQGSRANWNILKQSCKMLQDVARPWACQNGKATPGRPSNAFCTRQSETLFTLFSWSEKNHCVSFQCEFIWMYHRVSACRVLSLRILRQSTSKGCCQRDQRVRALTALFAFNSQDRKRSHSLYLVRLELNKIWHGVASLDLSDFQRFLGIRESLFFGSHVSFGVLWEFGKAGAILKAVLCALMCLL
jgi:hypothetical protein